MKCDVCSKEMETFDTFPLKTIDYTLHYCKNHIVSQVNECIKRLKDLEIERKTQEMKSKVNEVNEIRLKDKESGIIGPLNELQGKVYTSIIDEPRTLNEISEYVYLTQETVINILGELYEIVEEVEGKWQKK